MSLINKYETRCNSLCYTKKMYYSQSRPRFFSFYNENYFCCADMLKEILLFTCGIVLSFCIRNLEIILRASLSIFDNSTFLLVSDWPCKYPLNLLLAKDRIGYKLKIFHRLSLVANLPIINIYSLSSKKKIVVCPCRQNYSRHFHFPCTFHITLFQQLLEVDSYLILIFQRLLSTVW